MDVTCGYWNKHDCKNTNSDKEEGERCVSKVRVPLPRGRWRRGSRVHQRMYSVRLLLFYEKQSILNNDYKKHSLLVRNLVR